MPFSLQLVEFDGEVEHVYVLINYPLQAQLSKMINSIKGLSSILLKKLFFNITKSYFNKNLFGLLDILQLRVVVLQSVLFVNILSNKKHQTSVACCE